MRRVNPFIENSVESGISQFLAPKRIQKIDEMSSSAWVSTSPQRRGDWAGTEGSDDVTALQLLDTSRRFKAKRKGENSPFRIEASTETTR
jgi:hypothetical protein